MADLSSWGYQASRKADDAAGRADAEDRTLAIGEGLAAVAYALLEVALAIREHTEATTE